MRATTRPARPGTWPPTSGPASSCSPRARMTSSSSSSTPRRYGLQVVPQGTSHNATPIRWHDDMILLSTSRMRGVEIDVEGRRARVAAGTEWLEVTEIASPHKLAPLAGSSPNVGVIGYCLGGGISWLGRKHGLAANSVLAIEIVTADGRLRRVDADNDPD